MAQGFCSNPSLRGLEDANVLETMFDRSYCVKLICCIKTLKKKKKRCEKLNFRSIYTMTCKNMKAA